MSCEDELESKSSHCKCLNKQIKELKHPSAASMLIDDIMKKYFCTKSDQGSSCSLFSAPNQSVYSMDKRLLYWTKILEDRKKLACRIRKVTGKRLSHVLYNQLEDHRNVQNVKRIIDVAERLDPTKLAMRKPINLRRPSLIETLPLSEKIQTANIEIVGMPKVSRDEQWMKQGDNAFLSSDSLQRKIKSTPFSKIIEYYPETDGLEIVGKRIHKHTKPMIERDSDFELSTMSSFSQVESLDFPEYSIQIDDCTLRMDDDKSIKPLKFHLEFKCLPFEEQTLVGFRIRNTGRKPVRFAWKKIKPNGFAFMPPDESVFQFNQKAFQLTYDESKPVEVSFKPNHRMIYADQWQLCTEPSFFQETKTIHLELSGECYIPEIYLNIITRDIIEMVISNVLPGKVGQRTVLTECELFEKLNPGFKCNSEDLQKFKEIFRQFKNKSHPKAWDLKLHTLKLLIEGCRNFIKRNQGLNGFRRIIREMRRRISHCDTSVKIQLGASAIRSFLDKWETKAIQIVNSVALTEIDILVIKMPFIIEKFEQDHSLEDKRKIIQHQALYLQMYCNFCDLTEEIVTFIENCLLLEQNI
ncbi:uncharacterized protein LOC129910787 [Episyrphus balteatus]|uniref:uncharacterized protein LOC129910787 n=1 Tax=Episyrphus balteatus TaxID=286459 RepID=UPI0024852486|nr:uncharacterized protein LOC129910787 [Episyrphus balteatus]